MKRFIKRSVILMCCLLVSILIMPVSVNAAAKLNQKSITLNVGKTYILKSSGTRGKITWTSSNRSVASVTSRGIVKAVKKGTATITARYGKSKLTCKVTVKQPVTSIKLNKTAVSLQKGKTYALKTVVSPGNANNKAVIWTSSNKKVATVSSKGIVKAVGNGTATITATAKDGSKKKASCKVMVKTAAVIPVKPTDNSTVIITAKQLFTALEGTTSGKTYKLGKDIDIGGFSKTVEYFYGTLDGNGHKILNIKQPLIKYNQGTIRNIVFDNCNITGKNAEVSAATFRNGGLIDNCIIKGKISVTEGGAAAGLAVESYGTISHCINYANISVNGNYKDILGNDQLRSAKSGGICFVSYGIVDKCINYGTITGRSDVGGIVGHNYSGTINHCINYGTIVQEDSDSQYNDYKGVGGISGYNQCGKIYNSLNVGDVGNRSGIIGYNYYYESIVQNCVNVGKARYGICEWVSEGYIIDCYYLNSVSEAGVPESKYTRFQRVESNNLTNTSAYPTLDFTKDWTMDAQYPVPRQ